SLPADANHACWQQGNIFWLTMFFPVLQQDHLHSAGRIPSDRECNTRKGFSMYRIIHPDGYILILDAYGIINSGEAGSISFDEKTYGFIISSSNKLSL